VSLVQLCVSGFAVCRWFRCVSLPREVVTVEFESCQACLCKMRCVHFVVACVKVGVVLLVEQTRVHVWLLSCGLHLL